MELKRKTPGRKSAKIIASRTHDASRPYYRFNRGTQSYEFCFELRNKATGETYEVSAGQVEWQDVWEMMQRNFAEAPA